MKINWRLVLDGRDCRHASPSLPRRRFVPFGVKIGCLTRHPPCALSENMVFRQSHWALGYTPSKLKSQRGNTKMEKEVIAAIIGGTAAILVAIIGGYFSLKKRDSSSKPEQTAQTGGHAFQASGNASQHVYIVGGHPRRQECGTDRHRKQCSSEPNPQMEKTSTGRLCPAFRG
jgi:hypothetical protein